MTELQQLLEGEKPTEEIISYFDKLANEFHVPVGQSLNIGGKFLPIRDVGDAMNLKITFLLPS